MRIALEHCSVDLTRREARRHDGQVVRLTSREADLLGYLAERPGTTVGREALLREVWGYADTVVSRACDNTIARLRTKIEGDPANPVHLLTVFGEGYRFVPRDTSAHEAPAAPAPAPAEDGTPPGPPPPARSPDDAPIVLGERVVDLERLVVTSPAGTERLTGQEAELLRHLRRAAGRVVDREQLARAVWGAAGGRRLDNAMLRLRRKLEPDPAHPRYLVTGRKAGVQLVADEPATVPDDPRPPIGRDADLAALAEALAAPGWVLITGPGGVGKTRVARHVAAGWTGPAWLVDLGGVEGEGGVAAAVAGALRLPPAESDRATQIGQALRSRPGALLVLDELEGCADAAAALVPRWRAAAPGVRLLGTSRVRLGVPDEGVVELAPLAADAARVLFLDRARAVRRGFRADDAEVDALVDALDRLPLAIELAAGRAGVLTPAGMADRVRERLDLLVQPRSAVPRHRGLRAAVEDSFRALDPHQTEAMLLLALFRHGFDIDDVEGLLGPAGVDLLQALRDRSLVHDRAPDPEAPFGVLRTLRVFTDELRRDAADGGRSTELRWARWLSRFGDRQHLLDVRRCWNRRALDRHVRAFDDLRTAVRLALAWSEPEVAARCAVGALALPRRVRIDADLEETAGALMHDERVPAALRAWLGYLGAELHRSRGRPSAAVPPAELAAAVGREADPHCGAMAMWSLATARLEAHQDELGVRALAEAAARLDEVGMPDVAAFCRGRIEMRLAGDPDEAERQLLRARDLADADGASTLSLNCSAFLSELYEDRGAFGLARAERLRAVEAARAAGDPMTEALLLGHVARISAVLGDHDEAEALTAEAVRTGQRIGSPLIEAVALLSVLESRLGRRDLPGAQAASDRLLALSAEVSERMAGIPEGCAARVHLLRGDPRSALPLARRARERVVGRHLRPEADRVLALALAGCGDVEEAWRHAEAALAGTTATRRVDEIDRARMLATRGRVAATRGDLEQARRDLVEARAVARALGIGAPDTDIGTELAELEAALAG